MEIKATGVCHTDAFTLSGDDPEGAFPAILGHEGAGVVVEVGPGVTSLQARRPRDPLYTPECRECDFCLHPKTNLCQAIRATQGQGVMPDGTSRFSAGRQTASALHGLFHLFQLHGAAGDRAGQGARGRALRQDLLHRLRRHHRHRRGGLHHEGGAGFDRRGVRSGRHRPQRHPGREDGRRHPHHRRRPQSRQGRAGEEVRHDRLRQPERGRRRGRST